MNSPRRNTVILAAVSAALLLSGTVRASTLSWDADATYNNGTLGGTGTWNTSNANWDNGATDTTWSTNTITGDTALFAGTSGAVTLGTAINALGLQFTTTGYTLSGSALAIGTGGIDASTLTSGTTTIGNAVNVAAAQSWNVGSGSTLAVSGVLTGSSLLTKTGAGTLTLSGASGAYTGGLTISNGIVSIAADNNLGAAASGVTLDGGTLRVTAGNTGTHAITVGAGGGTININAGTGQYFLATANRLIGSGTLTVTGNGTLTKNQGNLRLGATNTYSGNMIIQSGGIMEFGVNGATGATATFNVNSQGEFAVNSGVTVANSITVNGGRLSFENGTAGVYSGAITIGASGAEITLQDWYGTTVRSGTITSTMSGTGAITVNSGTGGGGTLTLGGFDAKASTSNITINSSNLAVNSASGTAVASVTRGGNLTLNNSSLTVTGVASQTTNDLFGSLNFGQGFNTITMTPNAATNAQLTFASMGTRAAGSLVSFTGTYGGVPGVGQGNIFFTTGPSGADFVGGGGALGTATSSIIPWLRNSGGTNQLYTYDATRGVTAISGQTAFASAGATDNTTGVGTLSADKTVNSMIASGNVVMANHTLTVTSGAIINDVNLTFGSDTATAGTLNFGSAEAELTSRNARTLTINSAITGTGGLTYTGYRSSGDPNLILAGANTYTGETNFYGFGGNTNIRLTNSLALQNTTLNNTGRGYTMTFGNGGTSGLTAYTFGGLKGDLGINLTNNNTTAAAVALTVGGDNDSTTYSGALSNTVAGGSLIKVGSGTLTLSGNSSYSGGTTISSGILQAASANALGTAGNVTFTGGTLQHAAAGTTDYSARILNSTSTIKIDTNGQSVTYASAIDSSNTAGLTKLGSGTLNLTSSSNSYTGTTTVAAGTLSANSLSSGTINVTGGSAASAVLSIGSANFSSRTVNINTASGGGYTKTIGSGSSFAQYGKAVSSFAGGQVDTTAEFLDGVAGSSLNLVTSFSDTPLAAVAGDDARKSDVFSLSGNSGTLFALQLDIGAGAIASDQYLGWNQSNTWVNAVLGNTGNNATVDEQGYQGSFSDFQSNNGFDLSTYVGAYGVDVTNGSVWAVLNHNSEFAVLASVPEPSTWGMLAASFGLFFVVNRKPGKRG